MAYNLTENQKDLARWMVQEARNGSLPEEFRIVWLLGSGGQIMEYQGEAPQFTQGALDALAAAEVIMQDISYQTRTSQSGTAKRPKVTQSQSERSRRCTLTAKAFQAVDSDFSAPDASFVTQLTPLADVTNLDDELKQRCLPILGAGSADPMMWDSAVRTAVVILESRMRKVGGIVDEGRVGRDLVNDVFGNNGSLAHQFSLDPERQGYRDLYAGVVGVFRNRYAHRLMDPTPEDGGAVIVFVNLLLKMLADLRESNAQ